MDSLESSLSRSKREVEERVEARDSSRAEDGEDSDKRKHRPSKVRKHGGQEEAEEQDSGRRKSSGDRSDTRRKSGGSSRPGSGDEEDYEVRRESRSKMPRKSLDERGEIRSSDGYRDRDSESSRKNRDDERDWDSSRKTSTKPSSGGHEGSQGKLRSKAESSHERDIEKGQDRDSRCSDRKESSKEKDYGRQEQEKNNPRRRLDEADTSRRVEDSGNGDKRASDDNKHVNSRERTGDPKNETAEDRSRVVDSSGDKGGKSGNKDRRADGERSRGRSDAQDEDNRGINTPREVRDDKQSRLRERSEDLEHSSHKYVSKSYGDKVEKSRRDEVESRERSVNMDEDRHGRLRDRNEKETRPVKRSRTPERSGRYYKDSDGHECGVSESETERSIGVKGKERDRPNYRDDRSSKGKDNWEGSNDQWRRSHYRQDVKEGDNNEFSHSKEWDAQKRDLKRAEGDQLYGRAGYRKDTRTQSEVTTNCGMIVESSDTIEIRPNKNLHFRREESVSTFAGRKAETGSQQDLGTGAASDEEWGYPPEDRFQDDGSPRDLSSGRNSFDSQAGKGRGQKGAENLSRTGSGQSVSSGLRPTYGNNHGSGPFNRVPQQGQKGGRPGKAGRGRPSGRDAQRVGLPLPMMGPPFGPLGIPPGSLQPIGPNMTHSPGPPIGPSIFMPPFPGPLVWPGPRAMDMNMLPVPPNLPPIPPPGSGGPRFGPNIATGPNPAMYFNQPGPARGVPPNIAGPGFNPMGPIGRELPHDNKPSNSWGPMRNSGPSGKAPSRGEQNDYSQNFVDTGMRPQNFIRELELTSVVEDYPKLRELIQRKDEIVAKAASPPMYYKCDLKEHVLSPEFFGAKFDVILVDPPWEEYAHRAPGVADHLQYWTFEEIQNLKIEAIADTPSFIFLWVGDGVGLEQGRQCLKKWGFRRCEDICWVKTNKRNAIPGLRHDSHTLFQHSKEHCLMGIKGTVRRSTDGHIIHANIDTDIIIAEEPTDGSMKKPDDMYRIIEHFALGRRRLELFGEDHNIRSGWLTVGRGLSSSNFNSEAYIRNFADKDGKVWQGGGGRNPPPEAPHLVLTTSEIESLRPKSPPAKSQQQQQQQSLSLMSTGNSNNRRASANSPQNPSNASHSGMNQDLSSSEHANQAPWGPLMLRGPEGGGHDDKFYDTYGFNGPIGQVVEFDPHRTPNMNMM